jgi:hypothetical protein
MKGAVRPCNSWTKNWHGGRNRGFVHTVSLFIFFSSSPVIHQTVGIYVHVSTNVMYCCQSEQRMKRKPIQLVICTDPQVLVFHWKVSLAATSKKCMLLPAVLTSRNGKWNEEDHWYILTIRQGPLRGTSEHKGCYRCSSLLVCLTFPNFPSMQTSRVTGIYLKE